MIFDFINVVTEMVVLWSGVTLCSLMMEFTPLSKYYFLLKKKIKKEEMKSLRQACRDLLHFLVRQWETLDAILNFDDR